MKQDSLSLILTTTFVLLFLFYGLFRAGKLIYGPNLTIFYPQNYDFDIPESFTLRARAQNVSFIYLNGRQIYANNDGFIEEQMAGFNGYNIITLEAKDRFERNIMEKIHFHINKSTENREIEATEDTLVTPAN